MTKIKEILINFKADTIGFSEAEKQIELEFQKRGLISLMEQGERLNLYKDE